MLRHILLAVDGSAASRRAAQHVRSLLADPECQVTLLVAIEPPSVLPIAPFDGFLTTAQSPSPEEVATAQEMIASIRSEFGEARVHTRVAFGPAADTICKVADELPADLIVVGARGMNPAERLLLGSVSDRVVHHANQPVTVVR